MKKHLFNSLLALVLLVIPGSSFSQVITLGTAANFVLFTEVGAVTNTGITHLTGNVGSNSGSSTGFGNVDGQMHSGDGVTAACAADLLIAYNQLNTAIPDFFPAPLLGNGATLYPGVYSISAPSTLNLSLTLDALGDPNAVFIFQIGGPLSVNALAKVKLANGAKACNVYWKVEGLVSIASGATVRGTIVANNAAISMNTNDTLEGRALSTTGAITTNGVLAYTPIGCSSPILTGPAAPPLVSTAAYGLFSGNGPVTNTGITHVVGDVGTNVGLTTGFNPLFVTGAIHPSPDASTATCAADLLTVYSYLNTLPDDIELLYPAQFGNDLVLTPHTYLLNSAVTFTGNLYLNAEGNTNAVFVMQVNGAFMTSTFSKIILTNGAQAKNIFWKIDGAMHIYDNSIFNGTIVVNNGAIDLNVGTLFNGRALTTNGSVTTNAITGSIGVIDTPCAAPPVHGLSHICENGSTTLTDSTTGGMWTSSNMTVATIDSGTGEVRGILAGNVIITYTLPTGCIDTFAFTVAPGPLPIVGPSQVCVGSTITLTELTPGGIWSSSDTAKATVDTGVVSGIAMGNIVISYTVSAGCAATKDIAVGPFAGIISGNSSVCVGSSILLSDSRLGGTWSSSNAHANVLAGVVTGLSAGIDTISYVLTDICGTDTATKVISVDTAANAGIISGPSAVCVGSSITLTDPQPGGLWSASNASATVVAGIVTGITAGIDTIRYIVINACGIDTAVKAINVIASPNVGIISGPSNVCVGSSATYTDTPPGGVWSSSNATATMLAGVLTGVTAGIDTIKYKVVNTCGIDSATKIVNIVDSPNAGAISGPSNVCVGSSITLTDPQPGGVWSATNTKATVLFGVVTGISSGTDTIRYTVISTCGADTAFKIITVTATPIVGVISGPTNVCVGSSATYTDTPPGGVWSSSNATATMLAGVLTGVTAGIDTIKYKVINTCGVDSATKIVNIVDSPNAGNISGPSNVCVGSSITLTDPQPGGIWSATNTKATVLFGVVTGISSGTDTIRYTVISTCGADTAIKIITVMATPIVGVISGPTNVCVGSSATYTDTPAGGVWSSSNATATMLAGVLTGVTAGTDTIKYKVVNTCGIDSATKIVNIVDSPNAGAISGPSNVCVGSSITLTDPQPGGIWSATNAKATVLFGVVTGISSGTDTIRYTVISTCGADTAVKAINVIASPNVGIISGPSNVCVGSSATYTDTPAGGVWSSSNATATMLAGVLTGVTAGIDTIKYKVVNTCGIDSATKIVNIVDSPNAGTISGPSNVCVGSSITLTDPQPGGIWSATNAKATVLFGVVTGISSGTDTIRYTVISTCGIDTAVKIITVTPIPNAGIIVGSSNVCVGSSITLTDSQPGGTWNASNASAVVSGGVVTGVFAGLDTITYRIVNVCGADTASKIINVSPAPDAGVIAGPSSVCVGSSATLTDAQPGGVWSASNASATVLFGVVTGIFPGTDTISYIVTNLCGADTATKSIAVNPMPNAGNISGPSDVCIGSSITLTDPALSGVWSASNGTASVSGGVVTGITAGIDTISYSVTNVCGTDIVVKTITVHPNPATPVISLTSAASVCDSTYFQNFGASVAAPSGSHYTWSTANAMISDTGTTGQYALVNFKTAGIATVFLTSTINGTGCSSVASYNVTVNSEIADAPAKVIYFNHSFVCLQNTESGYEWGYDDAATLEPTIITGELNQDYDNASPDFTTRNYWVRVAHNGCFQKSYCNKPTGAQMRQGATIVTIYPNPTSDLIQVEINTTVDGDITIEVTNTLGRKMNSSVAGSSITGVDVSQYTPGMYFVNCYRNGTMISSSRFIKN